MIRGCTVHSEEVITSSSTDEYAWASSAVSAVMSAATAVKNMRSFGLCCSGTIR